MIKSFRHKGLEELFRTGRSRRVQAKHGKRLRLILTLCDSQARLGDRERPRARESGHGATTGGRLCDGAGDMGKPAGAV